ncbi:MAG: DNA repair protein RecN [Candidatus Cryptobacteroides sp.]
MLGRLQIKNYILIDSLEIDFPKGLIIITGQTGAGKSILLGALSLLMGAKADASMIGEGAESCVVEAEFDVDDVALQKILEAGDVEWDGGHLVIRRVINASGRSRSFVNDCPVPVTLLSGISSHLIDIHSQHQTLLLSDRQFQLNMLDHYAGNAELLERCAGCFATVQAYRQELDGLEAKISKITGERDYVQSQYDKLNAAGLRDGELAELEAEQARLANAEEIKEALTVVESGYYGSDDDSVLSVDAVLRDVEKALGKVSKYLPSAAELAERTASCRTELDDIASEVAAMNAGIDVSPERLEFVEERMSLLYGLMTKYSCSDEAGLIAYRDSLSTDLSGADELFMRRDELRRLLPGAEAELAKAAGALHESREKASTAFAGSILDVIRAQELPFAVFTVDLEPAAISAKGCDSVVFKFSSTGRNAVDVAKCASGGEMSRIMLALKYMMARYVNMPTMIFDEIDTGVSGSVADKMGELICKMGGYMQVFAITHLPQVAAKGTAHYLVSKSVDTSRAVSTIHRLGDEERVMELARMLSGSRVTEAAIQNARSLLSR